MSEHARLSCSGSVRWENCAGSVREESAYPDISGKAAIDGTGSHLLLESSVKSGRPVSDYLNETIEDDEHQWLVKQDRVDRVQMCIDYINRRIRELTELYPACTIDVESESRTDAGAKCGRTDWWGTADITITVTDFTSCVVFLEVCDYKDGRGYVDAVDNSQLISYLIGKSMALSYRASIVQPKTNPPVRYQDFTQAGLTGHKIRLTNAAEATDNPDAELSKGEWCKWCKHKTNCNEHKAMNLELLNNDVLGMSNEDLISVLDMRDHVEAVLEIAKAEATARLERGVLLNGYVLGLGRKTKRWNASEDEIAKVLRARKFKLNDIYPPKLISPAGCMNSKLLTDMQKQTLELKYVEVKVGKSVLTVAEPMSFM